MPYDQSKTRDLLKVAAAYRDSPLGEYVGQLAAQLFDAQEEITAMQRKSADQNGEVQEAERRLSAESEAHRRTASKADEAARLLSEQRETLFNALTLIKADARSAKKIATEALAKIETPPQT